MYHIFIKNAVTLMLNILAVQYKYLGFPVLMRVKTSCILSVLIVFAYALLLCGVIVTKKIVLKQEKTLTVLNPCCVI